ncbi:thiaminase II [Psychroflexus tropicus]|uniref:thiaminase II n=1 Tax=Psychroflexus tropicus TaxID=197345 RepID=UPI0003761F5C|nr:thiaminase II [Psychroflexus tropicus]
MTKTWFDSVVKDVAPIMKEIKTHPFITELSDGTLDPKNFHFYMHQDSYYLYSYGKVLASIATRLKEPDYSLNFMSFSTGTIEVEKALHKDFIADFPDLDPPEKSPTCALYTGFLTEVFEYDSIEVSLAAVLPCFWIYKEVGDYLLKTTTRSNHPYQKWIDTYGGEDFATSVERAIEITEVYAQNSTEEIRKQMTKVFLKTAQLEWMFWDSAYRREQWPI